MTEDAISGWRYLAVLVGVTAVAGSVIHRVGSIAWYEALMGGLFVGVLVLVAVFITWPQWRAEWREVRQSESGRRKNGR